jgi:hypothetical protein
MAAASTSFLAADEHAVPTARRVADAGEPDRGLADPGGSLDHQGRSPVPDPIEETGDRSDFEIAPKDRGCRTDHKRPGKTAGLSDATKRPQREAAASNSSDDSRSLIRSRQPAWIGAHARTGR